MAPAQRIIFWQAAVVLGTAALIPWLFIGASTLVGNPSAFVSDGLLTEWLLRCVSMLMGGFSVVFPSWGYQMLTTQEHRGERLLLFAWMKIVGTIALLAISMLLAPRPLWLLAGLAIAYLGHVLGASRSLEHDG